MVLEGKDLAKAYKGRAVVRGVSLTVQSGEIVGLLGPNGAGKTTVFGMLVGLVRPAQGEILLDGEPVTDLPMYLRARKGMIYLPQEPSVFRKLTVAKNILAVLETLELSTVEREERLRSLLEDMGLSHLAAQPASTLSGGERRRVEIGRALATSPKFMLLDEPFAGIDPIAVTGLQEVIADLKRRGIGVLITDHNVQETLEITDRAYLIHEGQIIEAGTPTAIASSRAARAAYLGERFQWR